MKNDTKICIGALLLGGLATYYYAGYHALKNAATKKEIINHRSIRKSDLDFLRQVEFEDLSITTFDDLTLKGKFLPTPQAIKWSSSYTDTIQPTSENSRTSSNSITTSTTTFLCQTIAPTAIAKENTSALAG